MKPDTALSELIYKSSVQAFEEWRLAFPEERIFTFAISTIDDANYVNASINSIESYNRKLLKRKIEPHSPAGLDAKWGPWEWENEYIGKSYFSVVDEKLNQMYESHSDRNLFHEFRITVFESMLLTLDKLRRNAVISNFGDCANIVLFATVYGSPDAKRLHRRSASFFHDPSETAEFLVVMG